MTRLVSAGAALTRRWTGLYTRGLDPGAGAARRAEIESDLWEHVSHRRSQGQRPLITAVEIARRCAVGAPADLTWRAVQIHAHGNARTQQSGDPMKLRAQWWKATALAVVALYGIMAIQNFMQGAVRTGVVIAAFAAAVLAGMLVRTTSALAGKVLTIAGVAPAIAAWWTVVGPVCALATIAGVATDRSAGAGRPVSP